MFHILFMEFNQFNEPARQWRGDSIAVRLYTQVKKTLGIKGPSRLKEKSITRSMV